MNKIRNHKKGFTLMELLVVVLIIGILAAIALPQYKLAVAKSKYNTLKNITKSLKESVDRYYLTTGKRPTKFSDLDVNLNVSSTWNNGTSSFYISFPGVDNCEIYYIKGYTDIICTKTIYKVRMRYINARYPSTYKSCETYSLDKSNITHKVCQAETGKTAEQAHDSGNRYYYVY